MKYTSTITHAISQKIDAVEARWNQKGNSGEASPRLEFVTLFPDKIKTIPRAIHTNAQIEVTRAARSTARRADSGLSIAGQKRSFQRCMFVCLL
jgi:hypothetical protein